MPEVTTGERLARRWFSLVANGDFEGLVEMLHDEVQLVSRVQAGAILEGREEAARFIRETVATRLYETSANVYTPLETHVVVEGRMRWIDDDRIIRDDPVVWAMEFRDGLLLRFLPARRAVEAEAAVTQH